jgi:hypothetical protein
MRHSVFVVEVCARIDTTPAIFDELLIIAKDLPERATRDEAWSRHSDAAGIILRHFDAVERGCWEYWDDELSAKAMFDEWCEPVIMRQIPRQGPSGGDGSYRVEAGPRYMTFTLVYYLAWGSPSDLAIRGTCDVLPENLWRRGTFHNLLSAVQALSFASVKGDSMYMIPRDFEWGLTTSDLATPAFDYLRPIIA